jgi:hypothetical protein
MSSEMQHRRGVGMTKKGKVRLVLPNNPPKRKLVFAAVVGSVSKTTLEVVVGADGMVRYWRDGKQVLTPLPYMPITWAYTREGD